MIHLPLISRHCERPAKSPKGERSVAQSKDAKQSPRHDAGIASSGLDTPEDHGLLDPPRNDETSVTMFAKPVSEIDVQALSEKLQSNEEFALLDVREGWELERARIADKRLAHAPLSQLSAGEMPVLPRPARGQERSVYVICHHGVRSANVTRWLSAQGWRNVFSVRGGIDEYARKVDQSVGMY